MQNKRFILTLLCAAALLSCQKEEPQQEPQPDPAEEENYHLQTTGEAANDLLSDDNFRSLTVEIAYVEGSKVSEQAVANTKAFLEARLYKPDGISFVYTPIPSPGLAPYSAEDLRSVEDDHRTKFNNSDDLTAFLFIADGNYADNSNVLGIAYRATSMALFYDKINSVSGGLGQPSTELLETTVLNHEFGHILGLVNNGTAMESDHQDEANGAHCDVDNCLMYWAVETGDFVSNLVGQNSPPDLDAQCIADLRANGGK